MREIKFRGKRTDNGEWIYGDLIKAAGNYFILKDAFKHPNDPDFSSSFIEVIPETVGQYTGLKDKNNTEIYEGDIVKYGNCIYTINYGAWQNQFKQNFFGWHIKIHVICETHKLENPATNDYYDYDGYLVLFYPSLDCTDMAIENRKVKIIGNIYDNPELLQRAK